MRRWTVLALALALAGWSGCTAPGASPSDCPTSPFGDVEHGHLWPHSFNDGQASDFLYLGNSTDVGPTTLDVRVTDGSGVDAGATHTTEVYGEGADQPFTDQRFTPGLGTTHFGAVRLSSDVMHKGGVVDLFLRDSTRPAGCDDRSGGLISNWAASPVEGRVAHPGQGVHVWYAGFWENGTLFDTNLEELDIASHWPRAGWYAVEPHDPIPVYVYDQDRSEEPADWKDPFTTTPAAGSPADDAAGAGYFTTIKGFNEALKGLPVGSRIVVRIAPEDAYTQSGREDHPLYGDAIVFLIELADVVDVPCPSPPLAQGSCAALAQRVPPLA